MLHIHSISFNHLISSDETIAEGLSVYAQPINQPPLRYCGIGDLQQHNQHWNKICLLNIGEAALFDNRCQMRFPYKMTPLQDSQSTTPEPVLATQTVLGGKYLVCWPSHTQERVVNQSHWYEILVGGMRQLRQPSATLWHTYKTHTTPESALATNTVLGQNLKSQSCGLLIHKKGLWI